MLLPSARNPDFSDIIERVAAAADLGIKAHAHMLRHACGYKLANDGLDTSAIQAHLGHQRDRSCLLQCGTAQHSRDSQRGCCLL
jgi:integrase